MKLKINKQVYNIPKYSELTTNEFCRIAAAKVVNIPEYISLFTEIPLDTLMNAEYKSPSNTYVFASIFDVDVSKAIKEKRFTFEYEGQVMELKKLEFKTFGQAYLFDIYHQKNREEKISDFELFAYALSIAISSDPSLADVEEIKRKLDKRNWLSVIPHGFFLAKRFWSKRRPLINPSIAYTWAFNEISTKTLLSLQKLKKLETTST